MKMKSNRLNQLLGLAPFVLFLSSYIPLFLIIAFRQISSNLLYLCWGGFNVNAFLCYINRFGLSCICLILSSFGLIGTYFVFRYLTEDVKNGTTVTINEISNMNDETIGYLATYIIPIVYQDYSKISDIVTISIFFIIIYILYKHSKLLLVNPILSLKYTIYSIKYQDGNICRQGILISKDRDIQEADIIKIYNIGYQLYFGVRRPK